MASMECDFRYWKLDSIDDDDGDEFFSVDSSVANLASMLDDDVGVDDEVASKVIFVDIVVWPPFDDDDDPSMPSSNLKSISLSSSRLSMLEKLLPQVMSSKSALMSVSIISCNERPSSCESPPKPWKWPESAKARYIGELRSMLLNSCLFPCTKTDARQPIRRSTIPARVRNQGRVGDAGGPERKERDKEVSDEMNLFAGGQKNG